MARIGDRIENPATGEAITWLETAESTGGARLRFRFELAPGARLPVTHLHPRQVETFSVVAGAFAVEVPTGEVVLGPGDRHAVPAGMPHRWRNAAGDDAAVLEVTFEPARNTEQFLEQFFGLARAGRTRPDGTPPFLQIMAMANRYELYVAGPPVPLQRALSAILRPIARVFGYRAFSPELSAGGG